MTQRFEKREDCYYDSETGLEWSLDNYGPLTWQEAVDFCSNLGNGWRLPTFKELLTLVDYEKTKPATKYVRAVRGGPLRYQV